MVVQCPNCQTKGRLDDSKIPDQGVIVKCRTCGKRLRLHKTEGVSLVEPPESSAKGTPQPSAARPPGPPSSGEAAAEPVAQSPKEPLTAAPAAPVPSGGGAPQQPGPSRPPQPQPESPLPDAPSRAGESLSFKEPPPSSTVQEQQGTPPSAGQQAPGHGVPELPCKVCGLTFPSTEMVRFGNTMVCANCKPKYVQMQRTGISPAGRMHYGGFWIRFVAKFVDGILLGILSVLITIPFGVAIFRAAATDPSSFSPAAVSGFSILSNILQVALGAAYTTFFIGKFRATPGKMIFKLVVVTPDGGRVSYLRALGRHFGEMISALILAIGYIMAAFDDEKRALHDRICGTRVVYK